MKKIYPLITGLLAAFQIAFGQGPCTLAPPIITGDTSFCQSSSTTLDAGNGYFAYLWNTGSTAQMLVVTTGGTYTVTVTDSNSCTASASVVVTENTITAY